MKPYVPVLTAVIGIAIGWLAKPASQTPAPAAPEKAAPKREVSALPKRPTPAEEVTFTDRPETRPAPPSLRNLRPSVAASTQSKDEAKMLRLAEALNLTKEQQDAILKMIAAAQAAIAPANGAPVELSANLTNAATLGGNIEKSLDGILSPEQAKAFQELRKRSDQNQIEATAQKQLSSYTEQMDLTPEQREKALERLRDSEAEKLASRPAGLSLALDTSVLPMGAAAMNSHSVELMTRLSDSTGQDPVEAQRIHMENQRIDLDNQLELYKDILSPAQQAQLKLVIEERKSFLDRANELLLR